MLPRRSRSQKRHNPPPQPEPEGKKRLSPTSICRCYRFLSHHCYRNLPPNCTSCVHCLRSQRFEELESWDKILDEEIETRMEELNSLAHMLPISVDKSNIIFRLEEIKVMTGDFVNALLKKKALISPEKAEKAKALLQRPGFQNLCDEEMESLNREFEGLQLKKEKIERDIAIIPKPSKLCLFGNSVGKKFRWEKGGVCGFLDGFADFKMVFMDFEMDFTDFEIVLSWIAYSVGEKELPKQARSLTTQQGK